MDPNEVAQRLQNAAEASKVAKLIGPKFTVDLEPKAYEDNPRTAKFFMAEIRLISAMLELFFSMQGLTKVTMTWENLHMVRRPSEVTPAEGLDKDS